MSVPLLPRVYACLTTRVSYLWRSIPATHDFTQKNTLSADTNVVFVLPCTQHEQEMDRIKHCLQELNYDSINTPNMFTAELARLERSELGLRRDLQQHFQKMRNW